MSEIWGYPYRLGIGIFVVVGTLLLMGLFLGVTIWLENSFKKDKLNKK
ncbi:MAG TPA: hypothetical protein VFA47_14115 [Candidatus Manganitrophaceae bacterium]|nr:hypothetical protein [Candidatus Manganitrophaceae bacterium]